MGEKVLMEDTLVRLGPLKFDELLFRTMGLAPAQAAAMLNAQPESVAVALLEHLPLTPGPSNWPPAPHPYPLAPLASRIPHPRDVILHQIKMPTKQLVEVLWINPKWGPGLAGVHVRIDVPDSHQ